MTNAHTREWEDQNDYDVHRRVTKSMGLTPREYITAFVFDPLEPWHTMVRNRFPYRKMKDRHWLVWIHPRYQKFWGFGRVVSDVWGDPPPLTMWENLDIHKSIPEIKHYHIVSELP
jgi:hypothetical protein